MMSTSHKPTPNVKPYGTAKLPDYALLTKRLNTFVNWKHGVQYTPFDLADTGFIYWGINDEVQCFACGGILHNWTGGRPLKEHLRWFPNCKYAQLKRDNPNVLVEIWDNPAVMAILEQDYSKHIIEKAFNDLILQGNSNPDAGILMSKVLELDTIEWNYDSDENIYGCTAKEEEEIIPLTVNELENKKIDIKKNYEDIKFFIEVKKENKILKERATCRLCPQKANSVFLPCGHLVVCLDCTKKRKDCIKCRTLIRGIVKVYLV